MSQALALIAHDLKNALGSLEAQLAALPSQTDLAATQAASAQAHRHCQQLRQEFVQFLTLYAAEAGELRPLCEDESPSDLLDAVARQWQARLVTQRSQVEVTAECPLAPAFWYLDRRLVRLALDAALHNATDFARQHVWVSASTDDGWLVLRVQDDGPGLPGMVKGQAATAPTAGTSQTNPHAHPHDSNRTGLGTALAEAVAGAHRLGERQGHLKLFNAPGGGACFEMWLP